MTAPDRGSTLASMRRKPTWTLRRIVDLMTTSGLRTRRLTRANIHDPLYPHGSAVWGPSPAPGEALTPAEVGRQFVPRRMRAWPSAIPGMIPSTLGGKYVLVLPYKPDLTARAATAR